MRGGFFLFSILALLMISACSKKSTPPNDPPDNQRNPIVTDFTEYQTEFGRMFEVLWTELGVDAARDSIYKLIRKSSLVSKSYKTEQGINIIYSDGSRGGLFVNPEDRPTVVSYSGKNSSIESRSLDLLPQGNRAIFLCPIYSDRHYYADSILSIMEIDLAKVGFPVIEAFLDSDCGVERFCNIEDAGILHIYTHSLAWPTKSAIDEIYIMTGDSLTTEYCTEHSKDFDEHYLACMYVPFKGNVVFMNRELVSEHNNFQNDKTFVFLSFGYASSTDWLTILRFGDGVGCCLGYDWRIFADSNLFFVSEFYRECCDTTAVHELMISDWFTATSPGYIDKHETIPPLPPPLQPEQSIGSVLRSLALHKSSGYGPGQRSRG